LIFGYKPGEGRRGRGSGGWYGGDDQSTVFEHPSPRRNDEHPTSKPVALVEAKLQNSSRSGDLVLDPFLGSGSALIACERLQRRCYGLELDPRYADIVVARWERHSGKRLGESQLRCLPHDQHGPVLAMPTAGS
jgi:DNA modification methylase